MEYKLENSKFIGYKFKNVDKDFIKEKYTELLKIHKKAKHICYAAVLKNNNDIQSVTSNDEEPKGTSAAKIREVLLLKNVFNTVIFVIRYYGGVKLGASRLARVYKNVAQWTLEE